MWIGPIDLPRKGWTVPPDIAGIRVSARPEIEFDSPNEAAQMCVVGFGGLAVPEVENGEFTTSQGRADEMMLCVSNERAIVLVLKGTFDGGVVDARRGLGYIAEIPLPVIESATIVSRKKMFSGSKPMTFGFVASQGVFMVNLEPVMSISDGSATKVSDPTPFGERLVELCLQSDPDAPDHERARQRGWRDDGDGMLEFLFRSDFDDDEMPPPPPPTQHAEPPAPPQPESDAAQPPAPQDSTVHPPFFPVYILAETTTASAEWLETANSYLVGWTLSEGAALGSLRIGAITFAEEPTQIRALAEPDDATWTLRAGGETADLTGALHFLGDVIAHDLEWLRSQDIRAFRPTVVLLTACAVAPTPGGREGVGDGAVEPNLVVVTTDPDGEGLVRALGAGTGFVSEGSTGPADAIAHALSSLGATIRAAAAAVEAGEAPSLEFGEGIPGFRLITPSP